MPDLIRHPEGLEKTGFRLSPERRLSLNQAIYGQTLNNIQDAIKSFDKAIKLDPMFS
jgi:hypothetical protein